MQVFVKKADLAADPVPVVAYHEDAPSKSRNEYGDECTVLALPNGAVVMLSDPDPTIAPPVRLKSDWRNNAVIICNGEAYRRILESFSEFMQRNATQSTSDSIMKYGADQAAWPQDANDRQASADAGWAYVTAVRTTSDAMAAALPVDPTADSNWPTRIPPVYIQGY